MPTKKTTKASHKAADALDWDEAMSLVSRLYDDGRYRESMLVAAGCFLGLRISDILPLVWCDVCGGHRELTRVEKKTGKTRKLRLNGAFVAHADKCFAALGSRPDDFIFGSARTYGRTPFTRQRAAQILSDIKDTYKVASAEVFSAHSLRKTFGRRVWQQECEKGNGDMALMLLADVFGHSNVAITKRYLGIRQEEILSVYDSLE